MLKSNICSKMKATVTQSCPTGWDPMDCSLCRPEYWSGYSFPPLGNLSNLGIEPRSTRVLGGFFTS